MTAKRKITALLLCLTVLLSSIALCISANAAGTFAYTGIASKTELDPGDSFTIDLKLKNNPGILAADMWLDYDKTVFELDSVVNKADTFDFTAGTMYVWVTADDYYEDGILCTAKFTVKSDAPAGDYTIKMHCMDAAGVNFEEYHPESAVVNLKVKLPEKPATGISLDKDSLNLYTGAVEALTATVTPADSTDAVVWKTSNAAVATVDNTGKVTAVAPGTAVITATAGSKFASCSVKVENAPCTHSNKIPVAAKESTCTEKGWDAYEKCADCGKVLTSDGKVPFRPLAKHQGGTATCTSKAVCSVCHNPYGNLAAHSYTAEAKKAEALKAAGTCKTEAVYYYSCASCGLVEHDDAHTFDGDKDPANHVGGTVVKNQKEATCVEAGYTGDKCCADCGAVLTPGTVIEKADHTPAGVWSYDDTKHWKECTNVVGCGVKLFEGNHTSTGANVANCLHKAICDVCGVEYGEKTGHNAAADLSSDASGHWYACTASGCTEKLGFEAHTPDREGHATEEYGIKCTKCGYVIEKQLSHVHDIDATSFKYDDDNHWNTCSGCNEKVNTAAHDFKWIIDKAATETEKGLKHEECAVCGFKKGAVEIPEIKPSSEGETKGDETPSNPDSVPSTGDSTNVALLIVLMFVSGGVIAGFALYPRRKRVK